MHTEVKIFGKKYKVVKISVQIKESELKYINNLKCINHIDLIEAYINNVSEKLKQALIDEIAKTDAIIETSGQDANENTVHKATILVLEEKPEYDTMDNEITHWSYISNKMTKPSVYNKES